jgi:hypothetical protein
MKSTFIMGAGIFFLTLVGLTALGQEPRTPTFKRLDTLDEKELAKQLLEVRDLASTEEWKITSADFQGEMLARRSTGRTTQRGRDSKPERPAPVYFQQEAWHSLGLADQVQTSAELSSDAGAKLQVCALTLRREGMISIPTAKGQWKAPKHTAAATIGELTERGKLTLADGVPALGQMLQTENESSRKALIELLGKAETPAAAALLARRAVFDLSPAVRELAVQTQDRGRAISIARSCWPRSAIPGRLHPSMPPRHSSPSMIKTRRRC